MRIESHKFVLCLAAVLPALSLAASRPVALSANESREALTLLKKLGWQAADTSSTAASFQAASHRLDLSWQSDAAKLESLKEEINAMGQTLSELENLRASADPLEQKTIDDALPLLNDMAGNVTAAIELLNANQLRIWQPKFVAYADEIAANARRLSGSVNGFARPAAL